MPGPPDISQAVANIRRVQESVREIADEVEAERAVNDLSPAPPPPPQPVDRR